MSLLSSYEARLQPERDRFGTDSGLAATLRDADAPTLHLFLIHFTAYGVGMTEPVDGWIRRAGERCVAMKLDELGKALITHASHEAGHHLMMIDDTRTLVARWNARGGAALSAEELLQRSPTPGVQSYRELHERVIGGPAPFGQLAIEYEIERLSLSHGAPLIRRCVDVLGKQIVAGLSFLEEHVAVDAGHTNFNAAALDRLLQAHPDFLDTLVATGTSALAAYAAFLRDCQAAARELRRRLPA